MAMVSTNRSIRNLAWGESNQSMPLSTSFLLLGSVVRSAIIGGFLFGNIQKIYPHVFNYSLNASYDFAKADFIAMYKQWVANELTNILIELSFFSQLKIS
jgi:hypothetical protein